MLFILLTLQRVGKEEVGFKAWVKREVIFQDAAPWVLVVRQTRVHLCSRFFPRRSKRATAERCRVGVSVRALPKVILRADVTPHVSPCEHSNWIAP